MKKKTRRILIALVLIAIIGVAIFLASRYNAPEQEITSCPSGWQTVKVKTLNNHLNCLNTSDKAIVGGCEYLYSCRRESGGFDKDYYLCPHFMFPYYNGEEDCNKNCGEFGKLLYPVEPGDFNFTYQAEQEILSESCELYIKKSWWNL